MQKFYCEQCETTIKEPNYYGDILCEECEVDYHCERCGCYCYQESEEGMCEDCYDDYLEELRDTEDDDWDW